jgi:hypothetical protein
MRCKVEESGVACWPTRTKGAFGPLRLRGIASTAGKSFSSRKVRVGDNDSRER